MSKATIFIVVYSIVLIALFATFSYLMTTVDPPLKPGADISRRFGEDLAYGYDELESNDNVAYGLEKVPQDETYDVEFMVINTTSVDLNTKFTNAIKMFTHNFPRTTTHKEPMFNYTANFEHSKVEYYPKTMESPVKDLRRSINEERKTKSDVPRSLVLKIKDVDGQPRIEIKVVSKKSRNQNSRQYRSSETKIKTSYNTSLTSIKFSDSNITNEASIILENNVTLIVNGIGDSIDFISEEEYVDSEDNTYVHNKDTTTNTTSLKSITMKGTFNESHDVGYTFDLLNSNSTNTNKTTDSYVNYNVTRTPFQTFNDSTSNPEISRKSIDQNKSKMLTISSIQNVTKFDKLDGQSFSSTGNLRSSQIIKAVTSDFFISDENTPVEINRDNFSPTSLQGLLIPEATATLPINYHFIN